MGAREKRGMFEKLDGCQTLTALSANETKLSRAEAINSAETLDFAYSMVINL